MTLRLSSLLAASIALVGATSAAHADDHEPRTRVAVGTMAMFDSPNPRTNLLILAPLTIEVSREISPTLELFARGGHGTVVGDETSGQVSEVDVGLRWMPIQRDGFRAGFGLAAGWTRTTIEHKFEETGVDGVNVQPSIELEWHLRPRLVLGLSLFARAERMVGDIERTDLDTGAVSSTPASERELQYGGGIALRLGYAF